jgi:hypothetical protein
MEVSGLLKHIIVLPFAYANRFPLPQEERQVHNVGAKRPDASIKSWSCERVFLGLALSAPEGQTTQTKEHCKRTGVAAAATRGL